MTEKDRHDFAASLMANMRDNILPYWLDRMTDPEGGFYGRRDGNDRLDCMAPRGAILNARILWTFSAAYGATADNRYLQAAMHAYAYVVTQFIDRLHGGVFWSVDADGEPCDTKKQYYAIAFTIYGLAEYSRVTGDHKALTEALALFDCIEAHSRDNRRGGYIEASTRDWQPIDDMRLSDKDANSSKTMNTHLHIIEGYTALLRVSGEPRVAEATRSLLRVFLDRIIVRDTGHMGLFFDDDWNLLDRSVSYGHDIEASWLLLETARVLGDDSLTAETLAATRRMAIAALDGMWSDGSMVYELHADGRLDAERHWWVQAEALVGQIYLALFHGMPEYDGRAYTTWRYILDNLVDHTGGEWYWSRRADGSINRDDDKAGFWKCPYHNSRACMEAARLLKV